jgi:uncharacterized Zn-binding protein involved in type VI secretion
VVVGGGDKKSSGGERVGTFGKFLVKGCPFFGQGERRNCVK